MLCSTIFGLLLAYTVSLSSATVILENGKPIKWDEAFSELSELPTVDNVSRPNPWNYLHRMSLYKILIGISDGLMLYMGEGENQNPLWGLPLQLAWMRESDRLADPTNATTCGLITGDRNCISTDSWWSAQNYMVSVLPFLSAAKNDYFGEGVQVEMEVPEGVTDFCKTYDGCSTLFSDAMTKWDAFFQALITIGSSNISDAQKKDNALHLFWEAQLASILASAAYEAKKSSYSTEEKSFIIGWCNSAQYVAAAHFPSNLVKAEKFISPLPSRVLKQGDVAPNIEGISDEENNTLHVFSWMDSLNTSLGGALVTTWQNAMCSVETREQGSLLLEQALTTTAYTSISFMAGLGSMTASCWSS